MKIKKLFILPIFLLLLVGCSNVKTTTAKSDVLKEDIDETINVNIKKGYYTTLTFSSNNGSLAKIAVKDNCVFLDSKEKLNAIFADGFNSANLFNEDVFDKYYIGTVYREETTLTKVAVLYKNVFINGANKVSINQLYNGKVSTDEAVQCFDLYLIPKDSIDYDSKLFDSTIDYTYLFNVELNYKLN